MNTLKKTIAVLLVVSLAALTGCSDDGDKKQDANNVNNVNNTDDQDIGNSENDTDDNQADTDDNQADTDDNQADTDDNQADTDDNQADTDDNEETEVDGELLLKDLTEAQVNILCAYKFEQMEPTYDPAVPAGEGNCFFWGIDDAYMVDNSAKAATCQASMDACMTRGYNREDEVTDGCMDEDVRAKCELTVEEYKTCANDRAAASIAHNTLMLEKTCADLSTASGRNAIDDLMMAYENPESCKKLDDDCFYLD